MIATAEVHDALIAAEEALGLFTLEARSFYYWPWIRNTVFSKALQSFGLQGPSHASWTERPWREFIEPFRRDARDLIRRMSWKDLGPRELLVFNHNRQIATPAGYTCPYTGPFLAASKRSRWALQASYNGVMAAPPSEHETRYLEGATAMSGFASLSRPSRFRISRSERHEVGDWVRALSRRLGTTLPAEAITKGVQTALHERWVRRDFYPRLLDRVHPRAILMAVHYSRRCMPLTELARERGIPVIEVQHGLLGPTHLAYNYAPGRCPKMFPDYLFTFGDFWPAITPGLPLPTARTIPVGFPWLDQERAAHARKPRSGAGKVLLVLSQGSVGEALSRMAVDAHLALESSEWRIRYRLHPGERLGWRTRYPWLVNSGIEVDEAKTSVHAAFADADAQLGVYTTALYEGISYGLQTLVANLPGWEGAKPLIDAGAAQRVDDDGRTLAEALQDGARGPILSHNLWADEPHRRFDEALEQITTNGTTR